MNPNWTITKAVKPTSDPFPTCLDAWRLLNTSPMMARLMFSALELCCGSCLPERFYHLATQCICFVSPLFFWSLIIFYSFLFFLTFICIWIMCQVPYDQLTPLQAAVGVVQKVFHKRLHMLIISICMTWTRVRLCFPLCEVRKRDWHCLWTSKSTLSGVTAPSFGERSNPF